MYRLTIKYNGEICYLILKRIVFTKLWPIHFNVYLATCLKSWEWDGQFIIQTLHSRETQDVITIMKMFTTHTRLTANRLQIFLNPQELFAIFSNHFFLLVSSAGNWWNKIFFPSPCFSWRLPQPSIIQVMAILVKRVVQKKFYWTIAGVTWLRRAIQ